MYTVHISTLHIYKIEAFLLTFSGRRATYVAHLFLLVPVDWATYVAQQPWDHSLLGIEIPEVRNSF